MILSGSSNPELSEEVAARIGTKLGACRVGVGCKFDGRPDMLLMGKSSSKSMKTSAGKMFSSFNRRVRRILMTNSWS